MLFNAAADRQFYPSRERGRILLDKFGNVPRVISLMRATVENKVISKLFNFIENSNAKQKPRYNSSTVA